MRQPPPSPPSAPRDLRVRIGTNGIQVTEAGDAQAAADAAAQQARVTVLRERVDALRAERDGLVEQINDGQVAAVEAASKERLATVQAQLAEQEAQVRQLEDVLAAQGVVVPRTMSAEGGIPSIPVDPNRDIPENVKEVMLASVFVIGFPIALAFARLVWKRATAIGAPARGAALGPEVSGRLDRIEQAVDAIAVELERVSEGQRFVTKALAAGAAAAQPVAVPQRDAAEVPR